VSSTINAKEEWFASLHFALALTIDIINNDDAQRQYEYALHL
jgi:hypothetical protein